MGEILKVGQTVKWVNPYEGEENDKYIVIEVNGDRCIIAYICDLIFPPSQIAICKELQPL